jgi:FKBP-type peptidyl-prolyl cis-trans isomerase SlyD
MKVDKNTVVTFHYRMTDDLDGEVIENSTGKEPSAFVYGHKNMIESLEHSMLGKEPGQAYSVTLPPDLAYGRVRSSSELRVSKKNLQHEGKLEPGMMVPLKTKEGPRPVTVVKVGKFNVDIDYNHPLAGKTLKFDVEIVDVRAATPDELASGQPTNPQ